ncbi:MAG: O-antigen ligase family protein [Oligoflexia bacterium]|nr:O-antigen ligase family protein [Oligoflexia bacterium]
MKRLYLFYLFVLVQVLLSIFFLSDQNDRWSYYLLNGMQVLTTVGALLGELFRRSIFTQRRSVIVNLTILYIVYHLVQAVVLRQLPDYQIEFNLLKGIWAVVVWLFPILALSTVVRNEQDIAIFSSGLRFGTAITSFSVLTCFFANQFGIEFGEVMAFADGKIRFFGPLGDQVSYISALGLLLALSGRRVSEVALHSSAIFLTGTRGVLSVVAFGIIALAFFSIRYGGTINRRTKFRLRMGGLAAVVVGVVIAFSPMGDFLFERLLNPERFEIGFSTRSTSMSIGIDVFFDHPWFGVGYSGFSDHAHRIGGYLEFAAFDPVFLSNSANPYIEAAVNGGVFGLAIYLLIMFRALQCALRAAKLSNGLLQLPILGISAWVIGIILGLHTAIVVQPTSLTCLYFFVCMCFVERTYFIMEDRHFMHARQDTSINTSISSDPAPVAPLRRVVS